MADRTRMPWRVDVTAQTSTPVCCVQVTPLDQINLKMLMFPTSFVQEEHTVDCKWSSLVERYRRRFKPAFGCLKAVFKRATKSLDINIAFFPCTALGKVPWSWFVKFYVCPFVPCLQQSSAYRIGLQTGSSFLWFLCLNQTILNKSRTLLLSLLMAIKQV